MREKSAHFVVVGGGVAGVCCAEELAAVATRDRDCGVTTRITLVSGRSGFVKVVSNIERLGRVTESFDVMEKRAETLPASMDDVCVVQADVCAWNAQEHTLCLEFGGGLPPRTLHYDKLCIATGARARRALNASPAADAHILTLRDVDSVARLRARISAAGGRPQRVALVGNGGIATELVFELEGVSEIVWAIRDATISAAFFDAAAARFFASRLTRGRRAETEPKPEARLERYTVYTRPMHNAATHFSREISNCLDNATTDATNELPPFASSSASLDSISIAANDDGCALGPHWLTRLDAKTLRSQLPTNERRVNVIHNAHVRRVVARAELDALGIECAEDWPVWLELDSSSDDGSDHGQPSVANDDAATRRWIGTDFVIEATGVTPNAGVWARHCAKLKLAADGGIRVDDALCTSIADVYAAGDVCTLIEDGDACGDDFFQLDDDVGLFGQQNPEHCDENNGTALSAFSPALKRRPHWTQMRLWTQARRMGVRCAHSMAVPDALLDLSFELFTHVTTFFGYKVVFLGDFLAAKVGRPYKMLYRIREPAAADADSGEYIKIIIRRGRVHGAVLVGDTELEETFENLILNQIDVSNIEDLLLDPDVDLEDYFD